MRVFVREIAEVREELDLFRRLGGDPREREERRVRREEHLGRWAAAHLMLDADDLEEICALFPEEGWMWEETVLRNDGWVSEKGRWRLRTR